MLNIEAPKTEQSLFGLFSIPGVVDITGDEQRFADHADYETNVCSATVKNIDTCDATKVVIVSSDSTPASATTYPGTGRTQYGFTVQVEDTSSTMALYTTKNRADRAMHQMEVCTQKAVENELWTGALAQAAGHTTNHYLAKAAATTVTVSAVRARYALALLEKALGNSGCGTRGIIHMPRDIASVLPLREVDGHLETTLGNYVVAGVGYTGSSPAGVASTPTSAWMYATGMLKVLLSDPYFLGDETKQRVDRATNTQIVDVQRAAWVDFDSCAWFAAQVDLTADFA